MRSALAVLSLLLPALCVAGSTSRPITEVPAAGLRLPPAVPDTEDLGSLGGDNLAGSASGIDPAALDGAGGVSSLGETRTGGVAAARRDDEAVQAAAPEVSLPGSPSELSVSHESIHHAFVAGPAGNGPDSAPDTTRTETGARDGREQASFPPPAMHALEVAALVSVHDAALAQVALEQRSRRLAFELPQWNGPGSAEVLENGPRPPGFMAVGGEKLRNAQELAPPRPDQAHMGWLRDFLFLDEETGIHAGQDGVIRVQNLRTGELIRSFQGHSDLVQALVVDGRGEFLYSAADNGEIFVWDLDSDKKTPHAVLQAANGNPVRAIALTSNGKQLVSAGRDGIAVWDVRGGARARTLLQSRLVYSLLVAPDGLSVFAAMNDGQILRVDIGTGRILTEFRGHSKAVRGLALSPDGKRLVSASEDGTIRVWKADRGVQSFRYDVPDGAWYRTVSFISEKWIVAGNILGSVQAMRLGAKSFDKIRPWYTHSEVVLNVEVDPGRKRVATLGRDGAIGLSRIGGKKKPKWTKQVRGRGGPIYSMRFFNPATLAMSSHDGSLYFFLLASGNLERIPAHNQPARGLAVSGSGAIAIGGNSRSILLMKPVENRIERTMLHGHTGWIRALDFSPDGSLLASGGDNREVRIWNSATGALERTIMVPGAVPAQVVHALAFSPDGKSLLTGARDGQPREYDPRTGALIAEWRKAHTGYIRTVAFSPDGSLAASGGRDDGIWLWDARTRRTIAHLNGQEQDVTSLEFKVSGGRLLLLSGSDDKRLIIWDVVRRDLDREFLLPRKATSARFTPDGTAIIFVDEWGHFAQIDVLSGTISPITVHPMRSEAGAPGADRR